jgi:hypothetical protein
MYAYDAIMNSQKGAIIFYQNFRRGNLSLQFAVSLKPDKNPNEIKKGERIYDYENARWFALTEEEAVEIIRYFEQPNPPQRALEFKHFPEGRMSVLSVGYAVTDNKHIPYIGYTEIVNGKRTFQLALGMNEDKKQVFINFLKTFPLVKTLACYQTFLKYELNRSESGAIEIGQPFGNSSNNGTPNEVPNINTDPLNFLT